MSRHCCTSNHILLVFVLVTVLLCGCLDQSQQVAEGGIEGTGKTIGPISGFGSVHVNGVRYDTDNTSFTFEGKPGTENQLFQGMVITATGDTTLPGSTGMANTVDFQFNLVGKIDPDLKGNNPPNSIRAVGQFIVFDELTVLRNTIASDLLENDTVAVSGYRRANGQILATYLEKVDPVTNPVTVTVLEGKITTIDPRAFTFKIGEQLVSYASAQLLGFPGGSPEPGQAVRITGQEQDVRIAGQEIADRLIASTVENQDVSLDGSGIVSVNVAGVVTKVFSDIFTLNSASVILTPATQFENGTRTDISEDAILVARGILNASGDLVADEIIFISQPDFQIEAGVEEVDPASGTLMLAGFTVVVDNFTLLLDTSPAGLTVFSLDDIGKGDRLIVVGVESGERTIVASRLERLSLGGSGNLVLIEGHTGPSSNDPLFSIAGLPIDTTGLQDFTGFFEGDVIPISRNDFFTQLSPGNRVRVSGIPQTGSLVATRVALLNFGTFTMLNQEGAQTGQVISDIAAVWDGSLNTQADIDNGSLRKNMTIESALPTPFFGAPVSFHDVYVFGPGAYTFDVDCTPKQIETGTTNCPVTDPGKPDGRELTMTVGPAQLGVHLLFGWNGNNMDVVMVWDINGAFIGSPLPGNNQGTKGQFFDLVSSDGNGDGIAGINMVDGPFETQNLNLNLNPKIGSLPSP